MSASATASHRALTLEQEQGARADHRALVHVERLVAAGRNQREIERSLQRDFGYDTPPRPVSLGAALRGLLRRS